MLYWMHQDHIGRPRLVTARNGDVQWQTAWLPFGKQRSGRTSGTVPTDLRFPGQRWDWETGFAYNYFRDYDYATARYVQSDPIGLRGGWNTYAYVGGNPVMRVDPLGLDTFVLNLSSSIPLAGLFNSVIGGASVHGGGAISFPGFFGGEFDSGVFAGFGIQGRGSFMLAPTIAELGYYTGSVCDLAEPSAEFGVLIPVWLLSGGLIPLPIGPTFTLVSDESGIIGGRIGVGIGGGWQGSVNYTSVISKNNGFIVGWDDL